MRRILCLLALALTCTFTQAAGKGQQSFSYALPYGVSVSIPATWEAVVGEDLKELFGEGELDGVVSLGFDPLVIAVGPDPSMEVFFLIETTAMAEISPGDLLNASEADLKSFEALARETLEKGHDHYGQKIVSWEPIKKIAVGRHKALKITHIFSSSEGLTIQHLFIFYGKDRLFRMLVETKAEHEPAYRAALSAIIESFDMR